MKFDSKINLFSFPTRIFLGSNFMANWGHYCKILFFEIHIDDKLGVYLFYDFNKVGLNRDFGTKICENRLCGTVLGRCYRRI